MRCFDTAKEVIDGFSKEHEGCLVLDRKRLDIFAEYCKAIDLIADYDRAKWIAFKVSDENTVICKMMLPALETPTLKSFFCDLVARSVQFSVENEEGDIVLTFVFPSLWKKKATDIPKGTDDRITEKSADLSL